MLHSDTQNALVRALIAKRQRDEVRGVFPPTTTTNRKEGARTQPCAAVQGRRGDEHTAHNRLRYRMGPEYGAIRLLTRSVP